MKEEFLRLFKENRLLEAAELFLSLIEKKTFDELAEELECVDVFLRKILPALIDKEPSWLIKNSDHTVKFLELALNAQKRDYLPSEMSYHAMQLRCFLAIADALRRDVSAVHREV